MSKCNQTIPVIDTIWTKTSIQWNIKYILIIMPTVLVLSRVTVVRYPPILQHATQLWGIWQQDFSLGLGMPSVWRHLINKYNNMLRIWDGKGQTKLNGKHTWMNLFHALQLSMGDAGRSTSSVEHLVRPVAYVTKPITQNHVLNTDQF